MPPRLLTRREFLHESVVASAATAAVPLAGRPPTAADDYEVLFLGDVHFDRLAHHDMQWLEREKPNDVAQVQDYSRLTKEVWPLTLGRLRASVAAGRGSAAPVAFVAQAGDFVEGLCGRPSLAEAQCREAIALVGEAGLGAPFLFCRGNHDITGPGAPEAFSRVLAPFVVKQVEASRPSLTCFDAEGGNLAIARGRDWFLLFDAYDPVRALDWLARILKARTARHLFVLLHPPVVPYGARTTWTAYAGSANRSARQRLLALLGEHRAFVLTGHIHKYSVATRATERGPFVQLAISSVIPRPDVPATLMLSGRQAYSPEQVTVEPEFGRDTEADRRGVVVAEAPYIGAFEYGDVPGYARISIGATVRTHLHAGLAAESWRTIDLSALRDRTAPASRESLWEDGDAVRVNLEQYH